MLSETDGRPIRLLASCPKASRAPGRPLAPGSSLGQPSQSRWRAEPSAVNIEGKNL